MAVDKWISSESWWTRANGIVIDNLAQSICSTSSWTRIMTLLVDTSLVQGTIRTLQTFRLAVRWFSKITFTLDFNTFLYGPFNLASATMCIECMERRRSNQAICKPTRQRKTSELLRAATCLPSARKRKVNIIFSIQKYKIAYF